MCSAQQSQKLSELHLKFIFHGQRSFILYFNACRVLFQRRINAFRPMVLFSPKKRTPVGGICTDFGRSSFQLFCYFATCTTGATRLRQKHRSRPMYCRTPVTRVPHHTHLFLVPHGQAEHSESRRAHRIRFHSSVPPSLRTGSPAC